MAGLSDVDPALVRAGLGYFFAIAQVVAAGGASGQWSSDQLQGRRDGATLDRCGLPGG